MPFAALSESADAEGIIGTMERPTDWLGKVWYDLGTLEFKLMEYRWTRPLRRSIGRFRSWLWFRQARKAVRGLR
jgi:hypothetical protein